MPSSKPLRDYYKILGIDRLASHEEIRSAYRHLAKKFHPDVDKSDDSEFWMKLINEAYDVLGDKRKRELYDYVFLADSRFSSQAQSEDVDESDRFSMPGNGGFRNIFSHFIVSIVSSEETLNIILMVLVLFAVSLYLVFDQGELAVGLIALLFFLGSIVLMVRIVAEIFGRVGIRQEEAWFHEVFTSANYLPQRIPGPGTNTNKDS